MEKSLIFQDIEKIIDKMEEDIIELKEHYNNYKDKFKEAQIKLRREMVIDLKGFILDYDGKVTGLEEMNRGY